MKAAITITPCARPPVAKCQPGQWWRYEVATPKNHASGYAPGTKDNAQRVATAALQALQRMEGEPVRGAGRTAKRAGHNVATCNCRLCSNQRYKERTFVIAKKKRRRAKGSAA